MSMRGYDANSVVPVRKGTMDEMEGEDPPYVNHSILSYKSGSNLRNQRVANSHHDIIIQRDKGRGEGEEAHAHFDVEERAREVDVMLLQ